jgi:Fe-Mn family superoxide dismutase
MAFELPKTRLHIRRVRDKYRLKTMEIHHSKHPETYCQLVLLKARTTEGKTIENILKNLDMENKAVK